MHIVIEGPDGSGKSTLCDFLAERLKMRVQRGEGPEKYPGEINERASRWLGMMQVSGALIFDRHPCVSHPIYSRFTPVTPLKDELAQELYRMPRTVFVYCRSDASFSSSHNVKEYDTDAHLSAIERNHYAITQLYDQWALQRANVIYDFERDSTSNIYFMLKGLL